MLTEIKCSCCGETKDISNYYKRKDTKIGYILECKSCFSEKGKKYYAENSEEIKAKHKRYKENNREKIRERDKANREHSMAAARKWYSENKDKHRERQDKYDLENKDRLREARRKWEREKLATDMQYRLSKNLRRRISLALNSKKEYRTSEYLGCNVGFLIEYMEKQFTPEMNWDNYGTYWHIDHKTPVSWFDLTNKEEAAKAFHYTNMQPLEARENILKNNRYKHV